MYFNKFHTYIYREREKEREKERKRESETNIYIYMVWGSGPPPLVRFLPPCGVGWWLVGVGEWLCRICLDLLGFAWIG